MAMKTSKPRRPYLPWRFEDGPDVALRVGREYERHQLNSLSNVAAACALATTSGASGRSRPSRMPTS